MTRRPSSQDRKQQDNPRHPQTLYLLTVLQQEAHNLLQNRKLLNGTLAAAGQKKESWMRLLPEIMKRFPVEWDTSFRSEANFSQEIHR